MIQAIQRNHSLDALRGIAILLMVLSSSIAFGILPGWMYHAQTPPPTHIFNPDLPGITWVDLVFPFFLFTMGAAIPLALIKKLGNQDVLKTSRQLIQRYLLLVFFALFTFYARGWVMRSAAGWQEYALSISCFLLLFLIFIRFPEAINKKLVFACKLLGLALAGAFLGYYPFSNGFNLAESDIIIIVLANMALFGTLIWWFTRNQPLLRIAVLPLVMGILLAAKVEGSWNSIFFNWSPLPWMYKFHYLKYLFIVLPGTFAGEWLMRRGTHPANGLPISDQPSLLSSAFLSLAILIVTVTCLYNRLLVLNLGLTLVTTISLLLLLKKVRQGADQILFLKLARAGSYLLLLGLFFEAFEGGIKKDFSTFSYYFVSGGLAFLVLLSFSIFEKLGYFSGMMKYLGYTGKNPMVAYTAGNLFLIPLLKITGTASYLDQLIQLPAGGLIRGLVFTVIVSLVTVYCTKRNLLWRT
jgi:predicted acyltransferase